MKIIILLFFLLEGCVHRPIHDLKVEWKRAPLTPYHWHVIYDGGGDVEFNPDGSGDLVFGPKAPQTSAQTFSALLLLQETELHPLNDFSVRFHMTLQKQLRSSTPNEWETLWFISNYRPAEQGAKTANYFISKPLSGSELGRVFDQDGQKFLFTDQNHPLEPGKTYQFEISKRNAHYRVWRDGELIVDYQNSLMPESLYNQRGALGLYSEDAIIRIHDFEWSP